MWPSNFITIAVETRGLLHYRDLQKKLRCTDSSFDDKHFKILGFSDKRVDLDRNFAISQYVRSLKLRPFLMSPNHHLAVQPVSPSPDRSRFKRKNQVVLLLTLKPNLPAVSTTLYIYIKVKWSRYRPGVAQRVGRGIALLFHDRGNRTVWVVSSTLRPHFTPGKDPVPILQEAGWAPGPLWTSGKSRLHRDSIPDRPVRSQSLYRLSYPAHIYIYIQIYYTYTHTHAGLLARSQYSEGPATGHLDIGFSWFPCAGKQMLRWFPRFQVATTCFSCSPPDLNLLVTNFIFFKHVK